ncbi:MAG: hypothetical protein CVV27_10125 [Candidatus Melainabacteria bacterium HGW-Melainabacteria-1]|nr:MAG: hypothetical protein CVV27_10125 [Candidatus Melainabacteria bacterium HGW-Melainabacteria-1]
MRIAFLTRITRRFNGETLEHEPLGGTQSAMIYLARELQQLGHELHIFCQCDSLSVSAGVSYHPLAELARFARLQPLDVFVSVADELALKLGISARITLWWSHNDYSFLWDELPDLRAETAGLLATRADRVVAVSRWHADKLIEVFQLPPEHVWIARNGVHWPYFAAEPVPADPPRLLYTSVPDRGLGRLLDLFPLIQQQLPAAELHLYSSFQVWGKDADWDQAQAGELYQRAQALPGVFLHPPLPHRELAVALSQGYLLTYPQHESAATGFWAETSCIAALEAQAAGLPVISSARGALPETVLDGKTGLLIDGDPHSPAYAEAFVAAAVGLLQDRPARDQLSQQARQRIQTQFRWDLIAHDWAEMLTDFSSTRQQIAPFTSPFAAPRISVIIPTYNRARNLRHCLESLTWQGEMAFEVIVCDDGSSDDTREVALSFKDRLNLRYRWQPDLGFRAAEARNLGIQLARAKLLVFLDSDLVVPPSFLSAHARAHADQGKQKVVVNSFVWRMTSDDSDEIGLPPAAYIPKHQALLKPDSRMRFQLFEREGPIDETYFLDSNALSIKREDLARIGGFDADFVGWGHEDTELGYRLGNHGFQLRLIREGAESYHLYHPIPDSKDAERAVNWQRMTAKHGISKWYHPLWELPVCGQVVCIDEQNAQAGLPILLEAEWDLKTSQRAPAGGLYYQLWVEDGILMAIEPLGLGEQTEASP